MRVKSRKMEIESVKIRKASNGWVICLEYVDSAAFGVVDHVFGDYANALARMFRFTKNVRNLTLKNTVSVNYVEFNNGGIFYIKGRLVQVRLGGA